MTIQHAALEWRDGLPFSRQFQDVYFSASPDDSHHGLAESRYVFLQHNQLATRWSALATDNPSVFTIIETGFGSGLNFLAAVELWLETAPAQAHLDFVSLELSPFTAKDLQQAHRHFPKLAAISEALVAQYHLLHAGINQIELSAFRTSLTLVIGDVAEWLPKLNTRANAWFLDGFAPSKNPDMWQASLFQQMMACSAPGASFATFTCAGIVRRGLQAVGFEVQKVTGYGAKREMLCGHLPASNPDSSPQSVRLKVAIIGAGIAGSSTAWHLAQLGCTVTVFEQAEHPAAGASGNPKGMLYPRLNAEKPLNDQLALRSYAYTLRHYASFALGDAAFRACGLLQLGASPREHKRVHKVFQRYQHTGWMQQLNAEAASEVAGVHLAHDCLFYPDGAWVNPVAVCQRYLQHPNIDARYQHPIQTLLKQTDGWHLQLADARQVEDIFDVVVLANAADATALCPDSGMHLTPVRGQMGMFQAQTATAALRTILCGDGYLTPADQGLQAAGATFSPREHTTELRLADDQANLAMVASLSADFSEATTASMVFSRAAIRCGSPDYLPYVGRVLPRVALTDPAMVAEPPYFYAHVAHGSKGLLTAPFCAALLARRILQDSGMACTQLSEDTFWAGLQPQRHLFKQLGLSHLTPAFS